MMKKTAILDSTDSIDTQTLGVVRYNRDIQVTVLVAGDNVKLTEEQTREFKPGLVCPQDEEKAKELRTTVADLDVKVANGMEGLMEAAMSPEADLVVAAVMGMIRIRPAIVTMKAGKGITLANEETLVAAGHIIMSLAREKGVKLLPVDSEHSAISQYLQDVTDNPLHKILLTISGGPFRGFTKEQLKQARLEDTLKHPNWPMGYKIVIDSSTMVSKGLEVMGAHWLLGMEIDQAQAVVQPASIVHSMAEFEDGAVIAQLGTPDMKLPIQYALYYSERRLLPGDRLDFRKLAKISSEASDMGIFRGLKLAYGAGRRGGTLPTAFNAANRMVVAMPLGRKIDYLAIMDMIEGVMEHHCVKSSSDVA